MATLAEIYDWFMTGKKPTQAQFWASWGSFWNKNETIPQSAVSNLSSTLNAKAEKAQFDAHKTANDAHQALFELKQSLTEKGEANGYVPLNELVKIASQYLSIVDDLVTGGSTAVLSAEQGKVLQGKIDAINLILTSDDVNLDTVQELVDAIKEVETSLETILVNDLTTGGTTKALTAEMGKSLKALIDALGTNKVDKVAGERLISAAEITKLANVSNATTTIKSILSTALATQNVAGFVTYLNALTPVLAVGANETVKYKTTDTGRVFELLLRGRSFGVGQAAITAADVIEITEFLNNEITFSNYPSTRNDGQLPNNKVLGVDAAGKVKLYSMAVSPAPWIRELIPDSYLPSTTGNIIILGDFFTPAMCDRVNNPNAIILGGVNTIHYATFVSSQEILINVTTGSVEGTFSCTLDNGLSTTKMNVLLIVLGTVFNPITSEWILTEPVNVEDDKIFVQNYNSLGKAKWSKEFDYTKNWSVRWRYKASPLGNSSGSNNEFYFIKATDESVVGFFRIYLVADVQPYFSSSETGLAKLSQYSYAVFFADTFELRYLSGILYIYMNNVLKRTLTTPLTTNLKLQVNATTIDVIDVRYIELAT